MSSFYIKNKKKLVFVVVTFTCFPWLAAAAAKTANANTSISIYILFCSLIYFHCVIKKKKTREKKNSYVRTGDFVLTEEFYSHCGLARSDYLFYMYIIIFLCNFSQLTMLILPKNNVFYHDRIDLIGAEQHPNIDQEPMEMGSVIYQAVAAKIADVRC